MALKIFLTGVTGYIGGEAFADLYAAHPEYSYALLVRTEAKGKPVLEKYPNVRLVYGNLDDAELLEKEAAAADVVIHTAMSADDEPSAKAIAKGIAAGHSSEKPGYWIHVSGTAILGWYDIGNKRCGEAPLPDQKYNDIQTIDAIVNLPDSAPHRNIDKIVLGANSSAVRTAVIAPPTIYGIGKGPVNTRSIQVPDMAAFTLEKGFAPSLGAGKTEWDNVHVHDLGKIFVSLVEATQDPERSADPELFGPRAYYFARGGEHVWSEVATWIAEEASRQGYLPAALVKTVTVKEAIEQGGIANESWGFNSKGVAERAAKYFGWKPTGASLKECIPEVVDHEAKKIGLEPKEEKKV